MGADRPRVTVSAATLAGGDKNQDRYAYGDGWAFVLDGASSFATKQPEHDGGWYAERLKQALKSRLNQNSGRSTPQIVADAIEAASEDHDDPATCPSSTIALGRWDAKTVEVYLLGDSTAALISDQGEEVLSDDRLSDIASPLRDQYQSRLRAGRGFDDGHRELLQQLQREQAAARNRPGGYWIAGGQSEAAHSGVTYVRPAPTIRRLVLATDGAASATKYGVLSTWASLRASDLQAVVRSIHHEEEMDPMAVNWPRSKVHDDKTLLFAAGFSPLESD